METLWVLFVLTWPKRPRAKQFRVKTHMARGKQTSSPSAWIRRQYPNIRFPSMSVLKECNMIQIKRIIALKHGQTIRFNLQDEGIGPSSLLGVWVPVNRVRKAELCNTLG